MRLNANKRQIMQKILQETDLEELLRIIDTLDRETRALVLQAISRRLDIRGKAQAMNQIREVIRSQDNAIRDWLVTAVAGSYASGANAMFADLRKVGVRAPNSRVFTKRFTPELIRRTDLLTVHKDAVNALVSDAYLDFANGMNGLVRGAEHQLNDALKRQIRALNISKQITGTSLKTVAKEVEDTIGKQGFSVLIDRGGKQWSLQRYSSMIVKTHTVKAANEGVINRANEYGVDTVQISTHPGACDICKPFEGKIFSIGGKSKKYPPLTDQPPFHPNCGHSLLPRPFLGEDIDS